MNILLINPPLGARTIGLKNLACIEPLGLEVIGAAVSRHHTVRLVDMMVRPNDLRQSLRDFKPDIAGVTSDIIHWEPAIEALQVVKLHAPQCLTVVGGHHATLCPPDFNHPAVDLVVVGEGVDTFAEICSAKASGSNDFDEIPGVWLCTPDGFKLTRPRPLPSTLDDQPFPDRSLVGRYRKHYYYLFEPSVAAVRTSVGCPFACVFCSCRVYSQGTFIPRSPDLVLEEIRGLNEEFVYFCDDHSFCDPERMRVLYFAYSRADCIVENKDVFALWARVGLSLVMTGLEALDDSTLRRTGKDIEQKQNEEALRITQELGIHVAAGYLINSDFGVSELKAIDRHIKEHPSILIAELTPLTPFPGTPLHRRIENGILTTDYQLYDMQHFVTETDLPAKELHRLILRSYGKLIWRFILKRRLWWPHRAFTRHNLKLLVGVLRSLGPYLRAHQSVRARHPGVVRDKSRAVETVLNDEKWSKWSDREITNQTKAVVEACSDRDEVR
jgi:radical SAM superfamily enzyme YgiQ (UPF0313 family)